MKIVAVRAPSSDRLKLEIPTALHELRDTPALHELITTSLSASGANGAMGGSSSALRDGHAPGGGFTDLVNTARWYPGVAGLYLISDLNKVTVDVAAVSTDIITSNIIGTFDELGAFSQNHTIDGSSLGNVSAWVQSGVVSLDADGYIVPTYSYIAIPGGATYTWTRRIVAIKLADASI